jgi:D-alanine-D-alanine ligase
MKKKIAVVRGGPSSENEVSMKTGRTVIDELGKEHDILDIVIDKQGVWICQGREVKPDVICRTCDLVFNALHGEYGEDGQVQRILEQTGVPFTGPKKMAAALSMNKAKTKEIYKSAGIKTPLYKIVNRNDGDVNKIAIEIFRGFTMPVIIKPVSLGSSVGISIARDYKTLLETLISLFIRFDQLLIEEFIQGKEATVAVIENFREKSIYSFLPVEIKIPNTCQFFDYDANILERQKKFVQEVLVWKKVKQCRILQQKLMRHLDYDIIHELILLFIHDAESMQLKQILYLD